MAPSYRPLPIGRYELRFAVGDHFRSRGSECGDPPFLDIVQYSTDNWLRCWFLDIDSSGVKLTVPKKLDQWRIEMKAVFREL